MSIGQVRAGPISFALGDRIRPGRAGTGAKREPRHVVVDPRNWPCSPRAIFK